MTTGKVEYSLDLKRILDLPRRELDLSRPTAGTKLVEQFCRKVPEVSLFPWQAHALSELLLCRGLLCGLKVGRGKTLISLLAAHVLGKKRPVLVLPASLVEKTERAVRDLGRQWHVVPPKILTYEALGRVSNADTLTKTKADLWIFDEAHRLKNPGTAVTRRVSRALADNPDVPVVVLTGSLTSRSLTEYSHLTSWALRDGSPLPLVHAEAQRWAKAVDLDVAPHARLSPGALKLLCKSGDQDFKEGFRERLLHTKGVVMDLDGYEAVGLTLSGLSLPVSAKVTDTLVDLRRSHLMPNGEYSQDTDEDEHNAMQLALGFYNCWDPEPPDLWLTARRRWRACVRRLIEDESLNLDSPLQVENAVRSGRVGSDKHMKDVLREWDLVKDMYVPKTKAVWLSDEPATMLSDMLCQGEKDGRPSVLWTRDVAFGHKMTEHGHTYFGAGGVGHGGPHAGLHLEKYLALLEDGVAPRSVVCSVQAHGTGKNMQHWNRMIVTSPSSDGRVWEQLLGRLHRERQFKDVEVLICTSYPEHKAAFRRALDSARYIEHSTGQAQKLLWAKKNGL